jgi:FimV-like protein
MRLFVAGIMTITALALWASAADKDTPAAANTRKKLQLKVSVDFKDETFGEIIKEIKKLVEDAGGGALSTVNDTGVSNNTKYSYAGNDQTVAEVLDGILKKNNLGYVVVSKQGDRYDGWLKFKVGSERGYPAGEEPKTKTPPKGTDKPKDTPAEKSPTDDDKAEKTAATKLDLARELIKDGKKDRAKERLKEIIEQFPKTKAADAAKKELEKLGG